MGIEKIASSAKRQKPRKSGSRANVVIRLVLQFLSNLPVQVLGFSIPWQRREGKTVLRIGARMHNNYYCPVPAIFASVGDNIL